jgi:hypothetical protein
MAGDGEAPGEFKLRFEGPGISFGQAHCHLRTTAVPLMHRWMPGVIKKRSSFLRADQI